MLIIDSIIIQIIQGNEQLADLLMKSGANVDAVDNHGRTPLFWAAFQGKYLFGL